MPCTCAYPVSVPTSKRRGAWGDEWEEVFYYCGNCGERLNGAMPLERPLSESGVDPRLSARKTARKAKARARRQARDAQKAIPSDKEILPGSAVESLQRGDKIVIRKIVDPFSLFVMGPYRRNAETGRWEYASFYLKSGMTFRVKGVRRHSWGQRATRVDLEGVGEGIKGSHFTLASGQVVFDRFPRSYEESF